MKRLRPALAVIGFWLLPALIATISFVIAPIRTEFSLRPLFLSQLIVWLAWGGWTALIFAVGDRFPFERGRLGRAFAVHVPLSVVVVLAQILFVRVVSHAFGLTETSTIARMMAVGIINYGDLFMVIFWGIVGARMAFRWHSRWREQSLRAERLREDLAVAQLRALQSQLNPHFLFNVLNSVVTLIDNDPAAAQRMVVRLSDLLRSTLGAWEAQEVPLDEELRFTEQYLEIERVRFRDRLRVEWAVECEGAPLVPAFGLQPLVENAIVHGVAPRVNGGSVAIGAARRGESLVLTVADSGEGPRASSARSGAGVGLANLRSRLAELYGAAARLDLESEASGLTRATLVLPWREQAAPA